MNEKMTQRKHIAQIQADAEKLTKRRLEDDGFEPHYPNGYRKDAGMDAFKTDEASAALDHVLGDEKRDALAKAREAKAAKKEAAKAKESTNEEGEE